MDEREGHRGRVLVHAGGARGWKGPGVWRRDQSRPAFGFDECHLRGRRIPARSRDPHERHGGGLGKQPQWADQRARRPFRRDRRGGRARPLPGPEDKRHRGGLGRKRGRTGQRAGRIDQRHGHRRRGFSFGRVEKRRHGGGLGRQFLRADQRSRRPPAGNPGVHLQLRGTGYDRVRPQCDPAEPGGNLHRNGDQLLFGSEHELCQHRKS